MSTDPVPNIASGSLPPTLRAGPVTVVYRFTVLLLLGICVWFVSRSQAPATKPAHFLPGNTWRHVFEFEKEQLTAEMAFRADGSITQAGSGQGKFAIISPNEISLDPTFPTGGLFGWPDGGKEDRWSVEAVGDDILLQRKSASNDRVVLHRVRKADEQRVREADEQTRQILQALQQIQNELAVQGGARRQDYQSIRMQLDILRGEVKKRAEDGKK